MLNTNIDKQKLRDSGSSHMKVNREYLLRKGVAAELNTYLNWNPFFIFGDIMDEKELDAWYKDTSGKGDPKVGAPGAKSIFNKFGAVPTGGLKGDSNLKMSMLRLNNNVPLIDTPENRKAIRSHSNCTIRELVDASSKGMLGKATYSYSDFMYCKYLGSMPNNYLITLRRFPMPVDDYISTIGDTAALRGQLSSSNSYPTGQLITWMNTPGNEMDQILTYSVNMPFEEKQAQWEDSGIDADASSKPLNAIASVFDKKYREQVSSGYAGSAVFDNPYVQKVFHTDGFSAPYHGLIGWQDKNKVYGPVDAVKKTYYRSDQGINFNQSFKLTFEYEIRSYNGINGRQAMLDLLSNILQVTYTTGTFWGGGYRGSGAHQNNIFANLKIMNTKGGFLNFVDAFFEDASTMVNNTFGQYKASWKDGLGKSLLNFINNLGGMLAGGLLNKLGRPQKSMVNSLLSPAPVGFWHVTIGNPFHPIMTMGNMILKNTTITHSGPLGIDDFPTGLKVECELERGKPRDLRGIENIYMNGNDRIYYPMGKHVTDMYAAAKQYQGKVYDETVEMTTVYYDNGASKTTKKTVGLSSITEEIRNGTIDEKFKETKTVVNKSLRTINTGLKHFFGINDQTSIIFTSEEQEYGSQPKTEKNKK